MAKVIVVTSGKGGVGKTTSTAAIGAGLAMRGKKTVVIDFDVGLRNLDMIMGCERRVVFDFINVIQGDAKLKQALITDRRLDNLSVLPTSQTRDKDALTQEGVGKVIDELRKEPAKIKWDEDWEWTTLRKTDFPLRLKEVVFLYPPQEPAIPWLFLSPEESGLDKMKI